MATEEKPTNRQVLVRLRPNPVGSYGAVWGKIPGSASSSKARPTRSAGKLLGKPIFGEARSFWPQKFVCFFVGAIFSNILFLSLLIFCGQ